MLKRAFQAFPLIAACAIGFLWSPIIGQPQAIGATGAEEEQTIDELLLSSGKVVKGRILEETETEIVFELHTPGLPAIEVRYPRAEVLKIARGVATTPVANAEPDRIKDRPSSREKDGKKDQAHPDAVMIYAFKLSGVFGRDVSQTPMEKIIEDINLTFDDAIPNPEQGTQGTIVDPSVRDKHLVIITIDSVGSNGFQDIFRFEEIVPYLEHEIHVRGRRVIFLVEQAIDGAAFLPWISPEMFFTNDGFMAFTSDFDAWDTGDEMVDEKLIGARIGTAQGFAIIGGYEDLAPKIIKAMARSQYWLAVLWTGVTPRLELRQPSERDIASGWEVLTDSGRDEYEDDMQKRLRDPNDQLRLQADTAFRLGVSDGTVEDLNDLLFMLGVHRNYYMVDQRADEILSEWRALLVRSADLATPGRGDLWREYAEDTQELGRTQDYLERRKIRGRLLRTLKQIRSIVLRVKEVFDPRGQLMMQIETQIYIQETNQRLENETR